MMGDAHKTVDAARIDSAIMLLQKHIKDSNIDPLISRLEALKEDPDNPSLMTQFSDEFNNLGIAQGAVLTYVPYVSVLLSDDPFGD